MNTLHKTVENQSIVVLKPHEYIKLKNPQFVGQTRVDENGNYYMFFEDDNITYRVDNNIYN